MLIQTYMFDEYMSLASPKYEGDNLNIVDKTVVKVKPTKELYKQVKSMLQALESCDADYIEAWDYTPEWEDMTINGQELVIDCCRLSVTNFGNVYWYGIVKHSNMQVDTEGTPISKLFSKFININEEITGKNNSTSYDE